MVKPSIHLSLYVSTLCDRSVVVVLALPAAIFHPDVSSDIGMIPTIMRSWKWTPARYQTEQLNKSTAAEISPSFLSPKSPCTHQIDEDSQARCFTKLEQPNSVNVSSTPAAPSTQMHGWWTFKCGIQSPYREPGRIQEYIMTVCKTWLEVQAMFGTAIAKDGVMIPVLHPHRHGFVALITPGSGQNAVLHSHRHGFGHCEKAWSRFEQDRNNECQ